MTEQSETMASPFPSVKNDLKRRPVFTKSMMNLSEIEVRLIQIALINAIERGYAANLDEMLHVSAERYAKSFDISICDAREEIMLASERLFRQSVESYKNGVLYQKARWISAVITCRSRDFVEIRLTSMFIKDIVEHGVNNFMQNQNDTACYYTPILENAPTQAIPLLVDAY